MRSSHICGAKVIYKCPKQVCINCKYFKPSLSNTYGLCTHSESKYVNIIDGSIHYYGTDEMRGNGYPCGVNAKYYMEDTSINKIVKCIEFYTYRMKYIIFSIMTILIFKVFINSL